MAYEQILLETLYRSVLPGFFVGKNCMYPELCFIREHGKLNLTFFQHSILWRVCSNCLPFFKQLWFMILLSLLLLYCFPLYTPHTYTHTHTPPQTETFLFPFPSSGWGAHWDPCWNLFLVTWNHPFFLFPFPPSFMQRQREPWVLGSSVFLLGASKGFIPTSY